MFVFFLTLRSVTWPLARPSQRSILRRAAAALAAAAPAPVSQDHPQRRPLPSKLARASAAEPAHWGGDGGWPRKQKKTKKSRSRSLHLQPAGRGAAVAGQTAVQLNIKHFCSALTSSVIVHIIVCTRYLSLQAANRDGRFRRRGRRVRFIQYDAVTLYFQLDQCHATPACRGERRVGLITGMHPPHRRLGEEFDDVLEEEDEFFNEGEEPVEEQEQPADGAPPAPSLPPAGRRPPPPLHFARPPSPADPFPPCLCRRRRRDGGDRGRPRARRPPPHHHALPHKIRAGAGAGHARAADLHERAAHGGGDWGVRSVAARCDQQRSGAHRRARPCARGAPRAERSPPAACCCWRPADPLEIAYKELREKKIPFTIRRYLPDGSFEDWALDELVFIERG